MLSPLGAAKVTPLENGDQSIVFEEFVQQKTSNEADQNGDSIDMKSVYKKEQTPLGSTSIPTMGDEVTSTASLSTEVTSAGNGNGKPSFLSGLSKFKRAQKKVILQNNVAKSFQKNALEMEVKRMRAKIPNKNKALLEQVGFRKAMTTERFLEEEPDKADESLHNRWLLACFIESLPVKCFLVSVIVLNAIAIGVEVNRANQSVISY